MKLTLDEIRRIVMETSLAYHMSIVRGESIQEAELHRAAALARVLRALHLSEAARQLEKTYDSRSSAKD